MNFDEFCQKVNELKCVVTVPNESMNNCHQINDHEIDQELDQWLDQEMGQEIVNNVIDDNKSEFLFINNGIKYYGNRSMVYGSMCLFDGMEQNIDFSDLELN